MRRAGACRRGRGMGPLTRRLGTGHLESRSHSGPTVSSSREAEGLSQTYPAAPAGRPLGTRMRVHEQCGLGAGGLVSRRALRVTFTRRARLPRVRVELDGAPNRFLVAPLAWPARRFLRLILRWLRGPAMILCACLLCSLLVLLADLLLLFHGVFLLFVLTRDLEAVSRIAPLRLNRKPCAIGRMKTTVVLGGFVSQPSQPLCRCYRVDSTRTLRCPIQRACKSGSKTRRNR
jgi:hypothetical protein